MPAIWTSCVNSPTAPLADELYWTRGIAAVLGLRRRSANQVMLQHSE
jgi:hypothetical protein